MNMLIFSCHSFQILLALCVLSMLTHIEASTRSKVEYLPGFQGPLPFELETGYVGLGENDDDDDMQVFYYFVKSENNPQKDPLMLWLSGGPGCSSLSGLVYEIGPIAFEIKKYNGSIPSLISRPHSLTKISNIVFPDLPLGTGFSYAKNVNSHRSDSKMVHHVHQFLRKWLIDHPEFISNEFYLGGDSYSGIPIPAVAQEISNGNDKHLQPLINLQGYILGDPITTRKEKNYQIPYARGMGLISNELFESLQQNCEREYVDVDSENRLCLRDLQSYRQCFVGIRYDNILDRFCKDDSDLWRRSLIEESKESLSYQPIVPDIKCQIYKEYLNKKWADEELVRKALHVREGTVGKWTRCYRYHYKCDISNSFEFHVNLSKKGFRSLIYNGDHDAVVPFLSTEAWIKNLNYSIVDDWRSWLVKDQVAGYTRTYSNRMTFATVKGSGHITFDYTPEQSFVLLYRWMSNIPL